MGYRRTVINPTRQRIVFFSGMGGGGGETR